MLEFTSVQRLISVEVMLSLLIFHHVSTSGKRLREDEAVETDVLSSTSGFQETGVAPQRQYRGQRIETPSYPGEFASKLVLTQNAVSCWLPLPALLTCILANCRCTCGRRGE